MSSIGEPKRERRFGGALTLALAQRLAALTRVNARPVDGEGPVVDLSFGGVATRASSATPADLVRAGPRTIGICHPDWRGIRAATYAQLDHVLEVPGITSDRHLQRLVGFIGDTSAERIVINGFPPDIDLLVDALARELPKVRSYFVYHGTPAAAAHELGLLERMLQRTRSGAVRKIGFVKAGLADYFVARGFPAETVMNSCRDELRPPVHRDSSRPLRIGVFGTLAPHKNVETQVLAALMIPGAEVHLLERPSLPLAPEDEPRIHTHGLLPHAAFLKLMGNMDATLYVSLVECYPMTVLESFFRGVLCLTSHTSQIFDRDDALFDALVVTAHDNPRAIADKLAAGLQRREELVARAQAHLVELNALAVRRFQEFIEE